MKLWEPKPKDPDHRGFSWGRWVLGAVLIALLGTGSVAQNWTVQHVDVRNGLPQGSVVDLAMDTLGFLWISTEGGLVRYDGNRLKTVRARNEVQGTLRMRELVGSGTGELLVFNARGHLFMEHGHGDIFRLASTQRVWLDGMVPRADLLLMLADPGSALHRAAGWHEGRLLLLGGEHWGLASGGRYAVLRDSVLVAEHALPMDHRTVFAAQGLVVGSDAQGRWLGMDPKTGVVRELQRAGAWPTPPHRIILGHGSHEAYLQAGTTLWKLVLDSAGTTLHALRMGPTLPQGASASSVLETADGNVVFVGTSDQGLLIYRRTHIRAQNGERTGDPNRPVYAMLPGFNGGVLAASNHGLVYYNANGSAHTYANTEAIGWVSLAELPDRRVLVGAKDGLHLFDPRTGSKVEIISDNVPASVFLPHGDRIFLANRLFFGYLDSAMQLKKTYDIGSEYDMDRPMNLILDGQGRMLSASCQTLLRSTDGSCTRFDTIAGVSTGICFRALSRQPEGILVGTYGNGLYFLDERDVLRPLPMDPLGALTHSHAVVRDARDNFWITTNQGLLRCVASDLLAALDDPTHAPFFAYYREWGGLANPEFNGGCQPAWARLTDGRLAFPAMNGTVILDPSQVPDPFPFGDPLMENIRVNGAPWPINRFMKLDKEHQEITFEVALPYWGDPANVQLQYRIPGLLNDWQAMDRHTGLVTIARPPPGTYDIELRQAGAADRGIAPTIMLSFAVPQPFWGTPSGLLLLGLAALTLVMLGFRIQRRFALRRERKLRKLVAASTAELAERNKELQETLTNREGLIAIITHDIVSPMRFIARVARSTVTLARSGQQKELQDSLEELSDSTEKLRGNATALLDWIKRSTNRLEPIPEAVDLHFHAEQALQLWRGMATERGISLVNDVPAGTILNTDREALRVMMNNTVGNAVLHAASISMVTVGFRQEGDQPLLEVCDNGKGLDANTLAGMRELLTRPMSEHRTGRSGTDGQGIGLLIVANMAQLVNARVEVESRRGRTSLIFRFPAA